MRKIGIVILLITLLIGIGNADSAALALAEARENLSNVPVSTSQDINQQLVLQIADAMSAGLEKLDSNLNYDRLTEQDQKILNSIEQKIPAILNKIQKSTAEVQTELEQAYLEVAQAILDNQSKYQITLDTDESKIIAITLANTSLSPLILMSGLVDEKVMEIMMNESLQQFFGN